MFTLWINDHQYDGEYRHASTARRAAMEAAAVQGCPVEVRAAGKARTVIHPDGRATPPERAEAPQREGCTAHIGARCFCTPCRDERKAARRA